MVNKNRIGLALSRRTRNFTVNGHVVYKGLRGALRTKNGTPVRKYVKNNRFIYTTTPRNNLNFNNSPYAYGGALQG
jgi:hypothetical protein